MKRRKGIVYDSKLDHWLAANKVEPGAVGRASGYSRQHFLRVRKGVMEPTRPCIAAIVGAVRRVSRKRVKASDLFDLGE